MVSMCGNGDTTGSAVLWPGLARLFLFMTTPQLVDDPSFGEFASLQGPEEISELDVGLARSPAVTQRLDGRIEGPQQGVFLMLTRGHDGHLDPVGHPDPAE